MSTTVYELFQGRTQQIDSNPLQAQIEYIVKGAGDEDDVEAAAIANIPTSVTLAGIPVGRIALEIAERLNATTWKVRATFKQVDPTSPAAQENTYQFTTAGFTQHVTQSLETVSKVGPGAADLGGAIGFDGNHVQGVDLIYPHYEWSETVWFDDSAVTNIYKGYLAQLTGAVNDDFFRVGYAGEILFKGASGSKQGNGMWQIAFNFAYQQNKTGIVIGDLDPIDKLGWDHLWVRYDDDVDTTVHKMIQTPIAAYVERVYPRGDFSLLGIGTT